MASSLVTGIDHRPVHALRLRPMASREGAGSLDRLVTEARRADADYDSRSTSELVELMNDEDASVPAAVASVADEHRGGDRRDRRRGSRPAAGSSTSAPARPAASARSTPRSARQRSPPRPARSSRSSPAKALSSAEREAAEDDADAGRRARRGARRLPLRDAVVGVSASGRTPYVARARSRPPPRPEP